MYIYSMLTIQLGIFTTHQEYESYISVLSPNGTYLDIHKRIDYVEGLVLYPPERHMFYLQYKVIQRSNMDGSQSKTIVTGLRASNGLTIDYKNGYLYWGELSNHFFNPYIKYCKLDGTMHSTLLLINRGMLNNNFPVVAGVYGDHLFVTFYKQSRLLKIQISNPNEMAEIPVQGGLGKIQVGNIYSSAAHKIPIGGVCACEDGVYFKEGSNTGCSNSNQICLTNTLWNMNYVCYDRTVCQIRSEPII